MLTRNRAVILLGYGSRNRGSLKFIIYKIIWLSGWGQVPHIMGITAPDYCVHLGIQVGLPKLNRDWKNLQPIHSWRRSLCEVIYLGSRQDIECRPKSNYPLTWCVDLLSPKFYSGNRVSSYKCKTSFWLGFLDDSVDVITKPSGKEIHV